MGSDSRTTIGKIAKVFDGPHATPKKIDNGPYFLSISSLEKGNLNLSKSARLSEEQFVKWTKRVAPKGGDVLFSYETRLGEAALMPDGIKACLGRRMGLLRPDVAKVDPRYLLFAYLGPDFQMEIRARTINGATVDRIALKELPDFPIKIPPLPEQKAIAHVLGTLDDRIELNRRMNETLEGMAQALFKSWFVDFDPVIDNALAAGRDIPSELKERAEKRKEVVKGEVKRVSPYHHLFPDKFTHTDELGWIPQGWKVISYEKFADLNQSSWTKKYSPENVQYVDLANTKNGKINLVVPYSFSDAPSRARRILKKHDIIIGTVRPGNRSFAYIHKDGLTGSTGFAVMTPKEKSYRSFVYLGLTRNETIDNFAHLADGAAYPAIRPDVVVKTKTILPANNLLHLFDSYVYPWIEKMGKQNMQAETLVNLRDTLLPKLLSGEVRIPEAEKMAGAIIQSGKGGR